MIKWLLIAYLTLKALISHKKEWNNAICSNVDGPRDYHTKWSKLDRETNIIWYHLYVESKKLIQVNLSTKQTQTHRHREQTYGYQRGKGGGGIN